jgi:glycerophosphoryl diester phosphodiesterase
MIQRIGHRGAAALAPENTLAGFALAADLGVDGVELDVRVSADGQAVVIHDENLDRTTHAQGPVAQREAAALAALGVPTLAEVLDLLAGRCEVTIELKCAGAPEPALAAVAASGAEVIFTSFDLSLTAEIKARRPGTRVGGIFDRLAPSVRPRLTALGADTADVHWAALTAEWVEVAHRYDLRVRAWTCNDAAAVAAAVAAGADAVMSDWPDRLALWLADGRADS